MLSRVVFLPYALAVKEQNISSLNILYDRVIGIFQDLAENCLVLIDSKGLVKEAWKQQIESWPTSQRKAIKEILARMQKESRFVEIDLGSESYGLQDRCGFEPCQHCFALVNSPNQTDVFVLSVNKCIACVDDLLTKPIVDIFEYAQSDFSKHRRRNLIICESDGKRNKLWFENKFLIPVFRHAAYVDIYDRMTGRTLRRGSGINTVIESDMASNYRKSLEWLLRCFWNQSSQASREREVNLYCEINTNGLTLQQQREACEVMLSFEREMKDQNMPIKIHLKKADSVKKMPHDRYIKTNQIAFQVGRGVDLLRDDEKLRDVTITYCPDIEKKIIKPIKDLDDLRSQ